MNIIDYLATIDSPTLVNAIELLKVRPNEKGFAPLDVRCLFPQLGRLCGVAVTAQVETVTQMDSFDLGHFVDLYRAVEASPKPAVIVLQEIGGHRDYAAHCGEVMATFFSKLGAVGLVSDCAVRDLPEVSQMGFRFFARGSVASHANYRIARINVPVQICGMEVRPGDFIHGDENGVITVPDVPVEKIRDCVEQVRSKERRVMEFVRSAEFHLDRFRDMVVE